MTKRWKELAKERGIPWDQVHQRMREVCRLRRQERERLIAIRTACWERMGGTWVKSKYRDAFENGDHDMIPGFDVLADGMRLSFGEIQDAEHLFEILKRPKPVPASWDEVYEEAIESLTPCGISYAAYTTAEFPFGHNVAPF